MRTTRDEALRAELVQAATPSPYSERMKPRTLIAGAVAIALASALTGGAVSAVTLGGSGAPIPATTPAVTSPIEPTANDMAKLESQGRDLVQGRAELFGTPFIVSGRGDLVVELGPAPDGASSVAIAVVCLEPGEITTTVNDEAVGRATCELSPYGGFGGSGGFTERVSDSDTTIKLEATGSIALWASWAKLVEPPAQSQAQVDALADGTVTAEEYDAGFDRWAGCMEAAGHPLQMIAKDPPVYLASASPESVSSGVFMHCYVAEFMEVDTAWQLLNEDTSDGTEFLRECLRRHDIDPAYPAEEVRQQLEDAGIDPREC